MGFIVHVEGETFSEGAPLEASALLLSNYSNSFGYCVRLAAWRLQVKTPAPVAMTVKLSSVTVGSLDVQTIVAAAAGVVPVLGNVDVQQIASYAWRVYKMASQFISMATKFFKRNQTPMSVNIIDSPGTIFNAGTGNVTISKDVYDAARNIHQHLDGIATQVKQYRAAAISIGPSDDEHIEDRTPLLIDAENKDDFSVESTIEEEEQPRRLEGCRLYRLNRETRKGGLILAVEDEERKLPFEIHPDQEIDPYIEALIPGKHSTVLASSVLSVNALGERSLQKLILHGITNS